MMSLDHFRPTFVGSRIRSSIDPRKFPTAIVIPHLTHGGESLFDNDSPGLRVYAERKREVAVRDGYAMSSSIV